jgi:hypothetical protein
VTVKPDELNPGQRRVFDTWRAVGLSESAAMNALIEDGVITLSEDEHLARRFQDMFGLSEKAAQIAAAGRDGARHRAASSAVSEVGGRSASPLKPGDNDRLISLIEQWASDIRFRGETLLIYSGESREQASRRAAYYKVLAAAQNDLQRLWIVNVAKSWRPELLDSPSSRSLNETTRKPGSGSRQGGTVHG